MSRFFSQQGRSTPSDGSSAWDGSTAPGSSLSADHETGMNLAISQSAYFFFIFCFSLKICVYNYRKWWKIKMVMVLATFQSGGEHTHRFEFVNISKFRCRFVTSIVPEILNESIHSAFSLSLKNKKTERNFRIPS